MSLTFIDIFSGIGGFRRGMELAGHRCLGFCEYDKFATAGYTSMHLINDTQREYLSSMPLKKRQKEILKEEYRSGEWHADDIRTVSAGDIPKADAWCFGFPCQDISIAGSQSGFKGKRSSLFFTVTGLIRNTEEENRPKLLFIENVKNLLSINRGLDFARLLIELDEIGYDAEWAVLNSKDFGVPQNRERVFIIGHLRGSGRRKVFPVTSSFKKAHDLQGQQVNTLTARSNHTVGTYIIESKQHEQIMRMGNINPSGRGINGNVFNINGISPALTTNKGEGIKVGIEHDGVIAETAELSKASEAGYNDMPKLAIPVLTPDRENKRQNGRRFKTDGEPMFTLTAQDRHGVAVIDLHNKRTREDGLCGTLTANGNTSSTHCGSFGIFNGLRIRKLTPKECFRLQGWTDDYFDRAEFVNSDNQLYKQAGNGVTVNVVKAIAERME